MDEDDRYVGVYFYRDRKRLLLNEYIFDIYYHLFSFFIFAPFKKLH